jgi:hypothetical protein
MLTDDADEAIVIYAILGLPRPMRQVQDDDPDD